MTTTEQIHWNQHRSQQMQNQNGHNFVIKPYKIDDNKAKISLPSCISPSQLQQVIGEFECIIWNFWKIFHLSMAFSSFFIYV